MRKAIAILIVAATLAGCDTVGALINGLNYANAVKADLARATGLQPDVGFNWTNGRLQRVTVTFPQLYDAKPLGTLADVVRAAVRKEFKQTPETIVLAFAFNGAPLGRPMQGEPIDYRESIGRDAARDFRSHARLITE
jgi:hypothetical protein